MIKYFVAWNVFIYLILSFVIWDLTWVKDVGEWKGADRGFFIFLVLCFNFILWLILVSMRKEK